MVKNRDDRQKTHIVDITGLAKVLLCSESMILKTWKQYPHFYIGHGCTAKGARFDIYDVIGYLKKRDSASTGQKTENVDRPGKGVRFPCNDQKRVHNKNSGKRVGTERKNKTDQSPRDPFNLLSGIH